MDGDWHFAVLDKVMIDICYIYGIKYTSDTNRCCGLDHLWSCCVQLTLAISTSRHTPALSRLIGAWRSRYVVTTAADD